jgi:hypothetical protein
VFIELVDALRCPNAHEDTWLVAAPARMEGRDIVAGTLGCPICQAEFRIAAGVAELAPGVPSPARASSEEGAMRLAALLGLAEPSGTVLLAGDWANDARALRDIADVQVIALDPPEGLEMGDGVSGVRAARVPLAPASLRAVALDAAHASPPLVDSAVRALRAEGRLVAPASLAVPAGIKELARDAQWWVGERERGHSGVIPLRRA